MIRFAILSLILLLSCLNLSMAQLGHGAFSSATAAVKGVNIEVDVLVDSLPAWHLDPDAVLKAADDGAKRVGWSINDGSEYTIAVGISVTRSDSAIHYHVQANGGFATTAMELLGAMRNRPTHERTFLITGANTGRVIDGIRDMTAAAARELIAELGRRNNSGTDGKAETRSGEFDLGRDE